ncbi:hypothetical protein H8959_022018 [Pygathrix nigripes]
MAPQSLPSSRMAPLALLLGLLMAACFTFCLSHQNPKEFALTNPEKSSTKETERKETKAEEELDAEVLEVFYPTHEWQALRPVSQESLVNSSAQNSFGVVRKKKEKEREEVEDMYSPYLLRPIPESLWF